MPSKKNKTISSILDSINLGETPAEQELNIAMHPAAKSIPKETKSMKTMNLDLIRPNPDQVRTYFDPDKLDELKESIHQNGLMQPISVTLIDKQYYMILGGERRYRAFTELRDEDDNSFTSKYSAIPVSIIELPSVKSVDQKTIATALSVIENQQRDNVTDADLSMVYRKLAKSFPRKELQKTLGISQSTLSKYIQVADSIPHETLLVFSELDVKAHVLYAISIEIKTVTENLQPEAIQVIEEALKDKQPVNAALIKQLLHKFAYPDVKKMPKAVYKGSNTYGNLRIGWQEKGRNGLSISLSGVPKEKREKIIEAFNEAVSKIQ